MEVQKLRMTEERDIWTYKSDHELVRQDVLGVVVRNTVRKRSERDASKARSPPLLGNQSEEKRAGQRRVPLRDVVGVDVGREDPVVRDERSRFGLWHCQRPGPEGETKKILEELTG